MYCLFAPVPFLHWGLPLAGGGHEHTYSEEWAFDATHHWHEATCEHSEETGGKAEHTWDGGTVTTPATCDTAGMATFTCTVCGASKEEPVPATGHSYAEAWTSDSTHHWHAATCEHSDEVSGKAEHTWDGGTVTTPATCDTAGMATFTCTVCGASKEEPIAAGHSFSEEWTYNDTHHWHEATCEHTEEVSDIDNHWWSGTDMTPATCETAGIAGFICTVCKATKTEPIAATGHSW